MYKSFIIGLLVFINVLVSYSQNTLIYKDEELNYKIGVDLFQKEKYAQAQYYFNLAITQYGAEHTDAKANAEYYSALCSIELFNDDAEYRISKFIADYPEGPQTRIAYFDMAKFKYRNKKYKDAIFYFDKVWKPNLTKEQLYEFYFKKGYSYYKSGNKELASKMFYEILDEDTKYSSPSTYYYAHIAYINQNYETALNYFLKLEKDPVFAPIIPYYVVQIYYLQGKTDKVLEYGEDLLKLPKTKREAEISRLVGEALYKKGQYQEAEEYLEKYKQKSKRYTRDDIYQLGYVYYMNKKYEKSVAMFSNITNVEDGLTQNAFFHMADCYLKLNKKEQARMAFNAASKFSFDKEIKEVSLLNYAKLSYELSYSPFNETIKAFENYLKTYPNSYHKDEAYGYLAKVYLTSKNYKEALESIGKIKIKSPEMMAALQRVAFYRGLELFNNLKFAEALDAFNLSLKQRNFDKHLNSLCIYWKAEALYRLDNYKEAFDFYNQFLITPGSYLLKEYNKTYYNMGYCDFKQKKYSDAILWFRKYTDKDTAVNKEKRGDAFIRIGDCYFVKRKYTLAVEYYNKAIILDTFDTDYAIFQKGFSYGLMKKYKEKIGVLTTLVKDTTSNYVADALFERARSYVALDSNDMAIKDFDLLLKKYPNSIYRVKALLQLGLLNYNKGKNNLALDMYKNVVFDYPGTKESKDALLGIKNIYLDINKIDDYFDFVKEYGGEDNISISEKDTLTYLSAEKIYMSGNWKLGTIMFNKYITQYPNGVFAINAHYYRGDCFLKSDSINLALLDFNYVINKPKNIFTESSLLQAANLYLEQGENEKAYTLFNQLENQAEVKSNLLVARKGQMYAAYKLKKYKDAIEASSRVLMTDKVKEEEIREARMIMGESLYNQNMLDMAIVQFRILALDVKNTEGAESKYKVAEILNKQQKIDEAEDVISDFINTGTPHQYWLAKAFLLLSDIYLEKDDKFQAKATLQSIIDNYGVTDDGIIKEASNKLDKIVTEENRQFGIDKSNQ